VFCYLLRDEPPEPPYCNSLVSLVVSTVVLYEDYILHYVVKKIHYECFIMNEVTPHLARSYDAKVHSSMNG
jgi:hypothetical protein